LNEAEKVLKTKGLEQGFGQNEVEKVLIKKKLPKKRI